MTRQRVRLRRPAWGGLTRFLTVLAGLVLAYGGVMLVLLATKVASPSTIDGLTRYRTTFHEAAALRAGDFTTSVSLIAGFAGLLVFLVFAFLTLQAMPRPYFARGEIALAPGDRGATIVRPRAVERIAELAAEADRNVVGAAGRVGDDELFVDITVIGALEAADTLGEVRRRVRESLSTHDLPVPPVHVTLTGYERPTRKNTP